MNSPNARARCAAFAAGAWSLLYGFMGLYWALGGTGFPFGANDPQAEASILRNLSADIGATLIAGLGLAGAVVASTMAMGVQGRIARAVLSAFAWMMVALLLLIVPDHRVLAALAYSFLLVFAGFNASVINQFVCIGGAILWSAAVLGYQRNTNGAALRSPDARIDRQSTQPTRWGRWAVHVAFVVPFVYASTRWAWAIGIPLGVSEEFLRAGLRDDSATWWYGAGLATIALGGALLTLGLIQPWGQAVPRWIPVAGGRRVPMAVAIVPAATMAILIEIAGLTYVRVFLGGGFPEGNVGAYAPSLLWPLWGGALGLATLDYYRRRRALSSQFSDDPMR